MSFTQIKVVARHKILQHNFRGKFIKEFKEKYLGKFDNNRYSRYGLHFKEIPFFGYWRVTSVPLLI